MNPNFSSRFPSVDIASITATIENALASAGLQTKTGPMHGVTETIRRALASAGMNPGTPAGTDRLGHRRRGPRGRRSADRAAAAQPLAAGERAGRTRRVRHAPVPQRGRRARLQGLHAGFAVGQADAADGHAARLHAVARRLRRRHADEPARRGARLHRRLPRAGRQRQRLEVLELVQGAGPGARQRRAVADRRHHPRGRGQPSGRPAADLRGRAVGGRARWR